MFVSPPLEPRRPIWQSLTRGMAVLLLMTGLFMSPVSNLYAQKADPDQALKLTRELVEATASTLGKSEIDQEQLDSFHQTLSQALAFGILGDFLLGRHADRLTDDQRAEYNDLLPDYLTSVFARKLNLVAGREPEILEAEQFRRDVMVHTRFYRDDGKTLPVGWRVRVTEDGAYKILDVLVGGISIMLLQREELTAVVANQGPPAMLSSMRAAIRRVREDV